MKYFQINNEIYSNKYINILKYFHLSIDGVVLPGHPGDVGGEGSQGGVVAGGGLVGGHGVAGGVDRNVGVVRVVRGGGVAFHCGEYF